MVSQTFANTRTPTVDLPSHALFELRRPRYTLYMQRLQRRLLPVQVCTCVWGALTFAFSGQPAMISSSSRWGADSWDYGVRGALTLYLTLSALWELCAVRASDWGGGLNPAQSTWLWPHGQVGEVCGPLLSLSLACARARVWQYLSLFLTHTLTTRKT